MFGAYVNPFKYPTSSPPAAAGLLMRELNFIFKRGAAFKTRLFARARGTSGPFGDASVAGAIELE